MNLDEFYSRFLSDEKTKDFAVKVDTIVDLVEAAVDAIEEGEDKTAKLNSILDAQVVEQGLTDEEVANMVEILNIVWDLSDVVNTWFLTKENASLEGFVTTADALAEKYLGIEPSALQKPVE